MPSERQTYDGFAEMPAGLRNFLLSDDFDARNATVQKAYNLTKEQADALSSSIMDAAFNDSSLPEAITAIKTALVPSAIPETNWPTFLSDILKNDIWPLRDLYGDELTQVMAANKIQSSGWPGFRVILKPLTYSGAASEIAMQAGFTVMSPQLRERLRDLVMSKAKGVRSDAQVRDVMMRGADYGGLGLDQAGADRAIATMGQLLSTAEILSEEEYADWLAAENRKKVDAMARTQVPPSEDDAEIAKIKANMPAPQPATQLDKAVDEIFATAPSKPGDEYLDRRLKYIISSRLRDVRSPLELKQLLMRDAKVGGLGLSREAADAVAAQVEDGYKKFHEPIMQEEKAKLDVQIEEQHLKIEERKKQDAEEHAQWYKDKVLARKQEEDQRGKLAVQMKQSFAAGLTQPIEAHPMDVKEQKAETARFGEMVPAVSAGPSPVTAIAANPLASAMPAPTQTTAPAQAARPEVKISKASAVLQAAAPAGRPRMDDISAGYVGPKLTGPVRELKNMSLSEFRRIAKDPQQAADKILQRIDVLSQESFDRRVEGIKAWQTCPLQQDYMSLVSKSFASGTPVAQLADEERKAGKDVPSPAELAAIITLNSKLHF
ncbi:MAG: hypothetical protein WA001_02410 [Patescibacteria group bacterium]